METKTAVCLLVAATLLGPAAAQEVRREGRYLMVPNAAGALRLDTETGEVAQCGAGAAAASCRLLPDERTAYEAEIRRLEERLLALEGRLAALESSAPPRPPLPVMPTPPPPPPPARLPDDAEIDRALDVMERVMRRFFGIAREFQGEADEAPPR